MDNFHFCSFLPALCRTQSAAINGAGTTSSYGLFRPVTTNGRKVRVGRSNPARQKAGYVYFIESLLPASWLGLLSDFCWLHGISFALIQRVFVPPPFAAF